MNSVNYRIPLGLALLGAGLMAMSLVRHSRAVRHRPTVAAVVKPRLHSKPLAAAMAPSIAPVQQPEAGGEAEEFCRLVKNLNPDLDQERLYSRLREQVTIEHEEALRPDGPYFLDSADSRGTPLGRLIASLYQAGFMEPARGEPDLRAAWKELDRLHWEDPANAAFTLFRLAVERKLDVGSPQIQASLEELARATKFDSLWNEFMRDVHQAGVNSQDPATFLMAISFLGRVPVPNYDLVRKAIGDTFETNPDLRNHLAGLLTDPALQSEKSHFLFGYNVLEYGLGRFYSDSYLPTLNELDKGKRQPSEPWDSFPLDTTKCGASDYIETRSKLQSLQHSI
jgi:hypothetical protein